jgi:hypothetical protein
VTRFSEPIDVTCPYCGVSVSLEEVGPAKTPWDKDRESQCWYLTKQCPRKSCHGIVFVKVDNKFALIESYPYPSALPASFDASIPIKIREDMAEAVRCYHAKALRAAVIMCRRVIQDIAKEKKLDGDTNKDQIKRMFDSGLITKALFDAAHEVRHFGGFAAHPQDDGLDNITPDAAQGMLEIISQFATNIYVMPAKNLAFSKIRQQAKQNPKGHQS